MRGWPAHADHLFPSGGSRNSAWACLGQLRAASPRGRSVSHCRCASGVIPRYTHKGRMNTKCMQIAHGRLSIHRLRIAGPSNADCTLGGRFPTVNHHVQTQMARKLCLVGLSMHSLRIAGPSSANCILGGVSRGRVAPRGGWQLTICSFWDYFESDLGSFWGHFGII